MGKILKILLLIATCYLLITISKYWYADHLYFLGKQANTSGDFDNAITYLTNAINISPRQPIYHSELALSYTQKYPAKAIEEITKAVETSPNNLNLKRAEFGIFIRLASTDISYLEDAKDVAITLTKMAPTDPRVFYNLGLTYARLGDLNNAEDALRTAVTLKPDYKEAQSAINAIIAP